MSPDTDTPPGTPADSTPQALPSEAAPSDASPAAADLGSGGARSPAAPRLSALVVVHNEEAQLAACLERLGFADELVVVLDKCTDGSRDIAARYTPHLVEGSWAIEGPRRNTGIDACSGTWILEIDADERVPPALATEIRATIDAAEAAGKSGWYVLPIDNYIGPRLVRYGWGAHIGVSGKPLLWRRGVKRWGMQRVHPAIDLNGPLLGRLKEPLEHYVDRDISDLLRRLDRYTTAHAMDMLDSGKMGNLAGHLRRMFSRFYKCYIGRKGYKEGRWGILIGICAGLYPILSYLKASLEPERYGHPPASEPPHEPRKGGGGGGEECAPDDGGSSLRPAEF